MVVEHDKHVEDPVQIRSMALQRVLVFATALLLVGATLLVAGLIHSPERDHGLPFAAQQLQAGAEGADAQLADKDLQEGAQGANEGGAGGESAEAMTAASQFAEARTAPGIVAAGAYSAALSQLTALPTVGGAWTDLTRVPYDADDPVYRDYYSNSSGGSGLVTGRITALAADASGHVYVGGADGGVWRSSTGGGNWSPIADNLPSLSSGDLQIASDGALWYATGEANTGGTSYVGSGVYRLISPTTGSFSTSDRVGGTELESTTINALRFDGQGRVWAATLRGLYWHADNTDTGAWTLSFAPNPTYLPGGTNAGTANAAYKNIVNDVVVDPKNYQHLVLGAAWRSGDTYNGFYESTDRGATWAKVNLTGGLDKTDIGNISFAYSSDGTKLYVINQSPKLINSLASIQMTYLDGVYVSNTGSPSGPWTKIASADKLASSGSALAKNFGVGYRPGIQSWYNQFLLVDPNDAQHVYLGLEEVYETKDGGNHWNTVGPYWNFYFGCWTPDSLYPPDGSVGCPQTTHSDQHSIAVGTSGGHTYVYVGNDGGVYRRPLNGTLDSYGHANDWTSLNDGTIDALQYYAVDIGNKGPTAPYNPPGGGVIVSGGLQDNGGSIFQVGSGKMSSNFGGDGGDVLVDPNNGCNILQEYVVLSLTVTQTCANPVGHPNAFLDLSQSTSFKVGPPDVNARFIAPFAADDQNIDNWLAGGASIWFQSNGFAIRSGSEWQKVYTFGNAGQVATAIAYNGGWAVASWCGPCNNAGFARGVAVGHYDGSTWTWVDHTADLTASGVPNRYIGGVTVDNVGNLYLAMNGFSRRFTEGPGAGVGHLFKSIDHGATWTNITGNMPDIPLNSVKVAGGGIVVASDLAVLFSSDGGAHWSRLGSGLPLTVGMDIEVGPPGDSHLYVATHGRGIWSLPFGG
jgi:hypothetical protein